MKNKAGEARPKSKGTTPAANAAKPTRRAPTRGLRARDEAQLREMVRAMCEAEFEAALGKPWAQCAGRLSKYEKNRVHEAEIEARRVYANLRNAIREAVDFTHNPAIWGKGAPLESGGGGIAQAAGTLKRWVPHTVEGLMKHSWLQLDRKQKKWFPLLYGRSTLVSILERKDIFGYRTHPTDLSRFLTPRETAIVSLLVGHWPELHGNAIRTPAEVIKLETAYIRPLVEKHKIPSVEPSDRGPR